MVIIGSNPYVVFDILRYCFVGLFKTSDRNGMADQSPGSWSYERNGARGNPLVPCFFCGCGSYHPAS
jgi:hypothetical protein